MRQSERRRLAPVEDLTSDLNSETDFNHSMTSISSSIKNKSNKLKSTSSSNNVKSYSNSDASKSQDFDRAFQVKIVILKDCFSYQLMKLYAFYLFKSVSINFN